MSDTSCTACNDLREYAPEFVVNGVTDTVMDHLSKDQGLSGASGHNNCEDLHDVNDCLIGNMVDELDAYDVCEWKDFMGAFIPNLYETIKAMVASACGQWCAINYMYNGAKFDIGEDTDGDAYVVAGKGVSFLNAGGGTFENNVYLRYIAGGMMHQGGSYRFYNEDFTDPMACGNFDNGTNYRKSSSRKGNSFWGTVVSDSGSKTGEAFPLGGELISEIRIKRDAYPQLKNIFHAIGMNGGAGAYLVYGYVFSGGTYAWGQHGRCNTETGEPADQNYDGGHLVPEGWTYLQMRLTAAWRFNDTVYEPRMIWGVRMNQDEIEC